VVLAEVLVERSFFSFKNSGFWRVPPYLLLAVMVAPLAVVVEEEVEFISIGQILVWGKNMFLLQVLVAP
jgi:hypothetical protein